MSRVSRHEKGRFRRSVLNVKGSNLAKRVQPRGGLRR